MNGGAGASVATIVEALRAARLLVAAPHGAAIRIRGITDDSRRVADGDLFIAVRGTALDGHRFIPAARAAGACMVLAEDASQAVGGPAIIVRDGRRAAAVAAAAFYGHPASRLRLIAVTGTNGKTTTVAMLRHIFDCIPTGVGDAATAGVDAAGGHAASIGTLGVLVGSGGEHIDSAGDGLTTPGPVDLQRALHLLAHRGVCTVAMEVSSHSLAQHRGEGIEFDAAIFTNFTRDHLDYHDTMEAYLAAKLLLADQVKPTGALVVNADDPAWGALASRPNRVTFGLGSGADVRASDVEYSPTGTRFRLDAGGVTDVHVPLVGEFNVSNALGAAAAAIALGMDRADVAARLATIPQVAGRLERICAAPMVIRDYAHTPDSLERALGALRPFVKGRLIVVFGAGGDRDSGKRAPMGAIAARCADVVIVTSDNPRTENPDAIIGQIVEGIGDRPYERIEDRRAAIARAIEIADPGRDLVLLAGKGHETYQIRGTQWLHFDEVEIVREIMAARPDAAGVRGLASPPAARAAEARPTSRGGAS